MNMEISDKSDESLDCTNTNIDEGQISESISKLRADVNRIESTTGPSKRTQCMRKEIKRLESHLA